VSIHVFTDEMSTTLLHHVLGLDSAQTPASLERFAATHNIPQSDVDMLASIRFRGDPPQTEERWAHLQRHQGQREHGSSTAAALSR
jgi:hypothetical protein